MSGLDEPIVASQHQKSFLFISKLEALYIVIFSLLIATTLYLVLIFFNTKLVPNELIEFRENLLDLVFDLSQSTFLENIKSVGLWFVAGSMVYLLIWTAIVFIVDSYNEYIITVSFKHPKSFHQSDYWLIVIARASTRVFASIVFIGIPFMLLNIAPSWFNSQINNDGLSVTSIVFSIIKIIAVISLLTYIMIISLRLIFLRKELPFEKEL